MAKKKDEKDVLVVRDEKTGEISVVAGLNADGSPKRIPAKAENAQSFLQFDRHGDVLDNFFRNFFRQCREPSRFGFYRVAADQADKLLEKELDKKIKRTPTDHPGYNEYQYHLDPIEHDPWQLTSFLTTLYDDYTRSEVQGKLKETFKKQYKLTTWVEVQTRYMTVCVMTPAGIPVPTQVPYEYRIFHTKLVNRGLEVVIREELNNDQWKRYEIFQDTLGGRPYLFNGGLPPGGSDGSGAPGIDYQVPAEALTDEEFAAIYKEAQKYVGTPYVWGGSTPETGFDCSGYVCWVYNQNGYDVGRTTANGLWQKSQHISEAEAKPGDLVFFKGTYDTPGMSHTGIYLGNGMMVSAGDPIKYANIHSSYWEKHLAGFGRLSK